MMNIVAKETCIMTPTNDYLFKRIFGQLGNEEITKGLVSSIIGRKIKDISLEGNTILAKDLVTDKLGILDVKIRFDTNVVCDVEMQVLYDKNIEERILYYWGKLYVNSIKSGDSFKKLKKTISILIANFEIKDLSEIHKFHTEWQIREKDYRKTILTNVLEIHIISLPKLMKMIKNEEIPKQDEKLAIWSKFIVNPEMLEKSEMQRNKVVKKAKDELGNMSRSEYEQRLAELREEAILDRNTQILSNYESGVEEAIKQGKKEVCIEIAKRLLNLKKTKEEIIEIIGLTKEEIEKIKI